MTRTCIVDNQILGTKNQIKINVEKEMHNLPDIYWLPKLHKNPLKARFIIADRKCVLKPLSKIVNGILKLFQQQIKDYYKTFHLNSGAKAYWVVDNNKPILDCIDTLNKRIKARSITFDFSTLYTNIPHQKLIYVLSEVVNFGFKGGGTQKSVYVDDNYTATWTKSKRKHQLTFSK